jgi:hypothetical protein
MTGWPRYLATARREEARLALAAGDRIGARHALHEYLALRPAPESIVVASDDSLRTTLTALESVPR